MVSICLVSLYSFCNYFYSLFNELCKACAAPEPGEDDLLPLPEGMYGTMAVFDLTGTSCIVSCLHPKGFLLRGACPAALLQKPTGGKGTPVTVLGMESCGWVLCGLPCLHSVSPKGSGTGLGAAVETQSCSPDPNIWKCPRLIRFGDDRQHECPAEDPRCCRKRGDMA